MVRIRANQKVMQPSGEIGDVFHSSDRNRLNRVAYAAHQITRGLVLGSGTYNIRVEEHVHTEAGTAGGRFWTTGRSLTVQVIEQ
ncbi:MAG TPA: hypothetical protein VF559_00455 [Caulobacteraceae bacterium]|jgi:hypothetical protein